MFSATMQQIAAGCEETSASIQSIRDVIKETDGMVQEAHANMVQTCENPISKKSKH